MKSRRLLWNLLAVLVLSLTLLEVWRAKPPESVTVITGPAQSTLHQYAESYRKALITVSSEAMVLPIQETLNIPREVNDSKNSQTIGFGFVNHDTRNYQNVMSLGVVATEPLLVFVRRGKEEIQDLGDLKGRKVILPPEGSAAAKAALTIMGLHGITPGDISLEHRPLAELGLALQRLEADAGFVMLGSDHPLVESLLSLSDFKLLDLPLHEAIARRVDYLVPMTLPAGAVNLGAKIPVTDIRLVGAPVDLIVHKDLHPALVQTMLSALPETHGGESLDARRGTYPTIQGSHWPVHPAAAEHAREGTPWMYERLYPWLAALLDEHWPLLLVLIGLGAVYESFDNLMGFVQTIRNSMAVGLLYFGSRLKGRSLQSAQDPIIVRLAEVLLHEESASELARDMIAKSKSTVPKAPS